MSGQLLIKKRRQYSPTKLATALTMVKTGAMSKNKASKTYGIPRTTLIDKLSGRTAEGLVRPGPPSVLTSAEEDVLVQYLILMASIGYPLTRNELLNEVKVIMDIDGRQNPFKNNKPGKDWFYAFKRRHPELRERHAMTLGHQRAIVNKAMIDGWFAGLFEYLAKEVPEHELLKNDPRRIFNADESGFPLCFKTGKVLDEKGARHVYNVTTNNKTQLTVMVCFNAFGDYVPPLIVFPGERLRDTGIHQFPEAIYGNSANGWMDTELFVAFLQHFSAFIDTKCIKKPVLLFVDGHSTHISCAAATFCANNGIILYCLLPNATHILQPCDVGFFSPMKSSWKRQVKFWQLDHIGEALTKKNFPGVFKFAWDSVTTFENAAHGFRRSGLFPLNPNGIDISKLEPSKVANPSCTASGDAAAVSEATATLTTIKPSPSSSSGISSDANNCKTSFIKHTSSVQIPSTISCRQTFVSPAFQCLTVPEPRQRKTVNRFSERLPKAISGSAALKMFEEREAKKAAELVEKLKRKEEKEKKKLEKEKMKEEKRLQREEMKQKRKEDRKSKPKKKRSRKDSRSSSSSESDSVRVQFMDSDEDFDESKVCPGCKTSESVDDCDDWVKCQNCPRQWHVLCTGDAVLLEIPSNQLANYPFYCEYCI